MEKILEAFGLMAISWVIVCLICWAIYGFKKYRVLLAVLFPLSVHSAPYSTLTNFFPLHFSVNPAATNPTEVIKINLRGGSFDTGGSTINLTETNIIINGGDIIYTNVTNFYESSILIETNTFNTYNETTNVFNGGSITLNNTTFLFNGNTVATLNPTDTYIPEKFGTNFIDSPAFVPTTGEVDSPTFRAQTLLVTDGALVTGGQFLFPVNTGTNTLNPFNHSIVYAVGADTNNKVVLTTGNGIGQRLILFNVATNNGFTMQSGPLEDDPSLNLYLRGGAWSPTQPGESLELVGVINGWSEIGRSNPNGPPPALGVNYWTNNAGVLEQTDLTLPLQIGGGLSIGTNTPDFWTYQPVPGEIAMFQNVGAGDFDGFAVLFGVGQSKSTNVSYFSAEGDTTQGQMSMHHKDSSGNDSEVTIQIGGSSQLISTAPFSLTAKELTGAPAGAAPGSFTIFAIDNGGGKMKLMVQFPTGAAQQIAIEP